MVKTTPSHDDGSFGPAAVRPWDARLAAWLVRPLIDTAITPNHVTTLRLLLGVLGAASFAYGQYAWCNVGAVLIVLSNFVDHGDGELARMSGKTSRVGHIYDLASDALVTVLLFAGIGIGVQASLPDHGASWWLAPATLGLVAGIAVALIFYVRLTIENRAGKAASRQASLGGFETEDVLYLLPLVTVFDVTRGFLMAAAVGAPLFLLLVLRDSWQLRGRLPAAVPTAMSAAAADAPASRQTRNEDESIALAGVGAAAFSVASGGLDAGGRIVDQRIASDQAPAARPASDVQALQTLDSDAPGGRSDAGVAASFDGTASASLSDSAEAGQSTRRQVVPPPGLLDPDAAMAARVASLDGDAAKARFVEQGAFLFIESFLPPEVTNELIKCVRAVEHRANRNYLPGHKQGGSVSRHVIDEVAPFIAELYRSPALIDWLERLTGDRLLPSPADDPHAYALYFYTRAGDHIGWHYDTSYYDGKRYTLLLGVIDDSSCLLEYRLHTRDDGKDTVSGAARLQPGGFMLFDGDKLHHRVTRSRDGEERVSLTFEYVTNPNLRGSRRILSNLKDAVAYFGFRQVFRSMVGGRRGAAGRPEGRR